MPDQCSIDINEQYTSFTDLVSTSQSNVSGILHRVPLQRNDADLGRDPRYSSTGLLNAEPNIFTSLDMKCGNTNCGRVAPM